MPGLLAANTIILFTNRTTGIDYPVLSWSVNRSISQMFSTGTVTLPAAIDVRLRDEVEIRSVRPTGTGVDTLIRGRVKSVSSGKEGVASYSIQSRGGDLADTDTEPTDWTYSMAADVIEGIAAEYGVTVTFDPGVKAADSPAELVIDDGGNALSTIADLCKSRGWIVLAGEDGGLRITTAGIIPYIVPLAAGIPPLIGLGLDASDDRVYTTTAKRTLPGEKRRGKTAVEDIEIVGIATDTGARSGTKAFIRSSTAATVNDLEYLAAQSALVRGAGGVKVSCDLAGLYSMDGDLWEPNRLITVTDVAKRIFAWTGLIESVEMSQSGTAAQATKIGLVAPAVYLPESISGSTGSALTDPFKGMELWR